MKYKVQGKIAYDWEIIVNADSEEEAEETARDYATDGFADLAGPFEKPEVNSVELVEGEPS